MKQFKRVYWPACKPSFMPCCLALLSVLWKERDRSNSKSRGLVLQQVGQAGDEKPNQIWKLRELTQGFIVSYGFSDALSLTCFPLRSGRNREEGGSHRWIPNALTPQLFNTNDAMLMFQNAKVKVFWDVAGGEGGISQQQWPCSLCSRSPSPLPCRSCSQTWPLLW